MNEDLWSTLQNAYNLMKPVCHLSNTLEGDRPNLSCFHTGYVLIGAAVNGKSGFLPRESRIYFGFFYKKVRFYVKSCSVGDSFTEPTVANDVSE